MTLKQAIAAVLERLEDRRLLRSARLRHEQVRGADLIQYPADDLESLRQQIWRGAASVRS